MLICIGWIICFFLKASPMVCVILWWISPIPSVAHASQLQFTMHTKGKMLTIKSTHHQSHSQSNGKGTKLGLLSVLHTTLKFSLCNTPKNSFLCDYAPKEDVSPLLEPYVATYYVQLISFQQWCELGKITSVPRSPCCHHSLQSQVRDTWRMQCMCSLTLLQRATPGLSLTQKNLMW